MRKLLFIISVFCSFGVLAKDLGQFGATFEVQETDMLELINQRLGELNKDGSLDKINEQMIERAQIKVNKPTAIELPEAHETISYPYYPTITLEMDLKDDQGNIIVPRGQTINALERLPFYNPEWLFIAANKPHQVKFAKALLETHPNLKIILTKGEIKKTQISLSHRVYFDQDGRITKKIGLAHVPAFVSRKDNALVITEYAIGDNHG